MKTDFTATGKRTIKGNLKDADTAIRRFFLGHFYDNRKQVIFNLFRILLIFHWVKLSQLKIILRE